VRLVSLCLVRVLCVYVCIYMHDAEELEKAWCALVHACIVLVFHVYEHMCKEHLESVWCVFACMCLVWVFGVYVRTYMHDKEMLKSAWCVFARVCLVWTVCMDIMYGVATISRLLKIIGLFCRISSLL